MAATPLQTYTLSQRSVAHGFGSVTHPASQLFGDLAISGGVFVQQAGGDDSVDLTIDLTVSAPDPVVQGNALYDIYSPAVPASVGVRAAAGQRVFTGTVTRIKRQVTTGGKHQMLVHLEGPSYALKCIPFMQSWKYPVDPKDSLSFLKDTPIPQVILFLEDFALKVRVGVKEQIQQILDYANTQGAGIGYSGVDTLPDVQPQEDTQVDSACETLLQRCLKWVPNYTAYWQYGGATPTLQMVSLATVPQNLLLGGGRVKFPPGVALVSAQNGGSVIISPLVSGLESFKSEARYDLLVGKVTMYYYTEQTADDAGDASGEITIWTGLETEVSTATNGSARQLAISSQLRGQSAGRDPATGVPIPAETIPQGLAAAIHAPFKELTHSVEWSLVGPDVDWATYPGMTVGVQDAGNDQVAGARAVIQKITRTLGQKTLTSYEAGPPSHLNFDGLLSLVRFLESRNSGRNRGSGNSGGGYNSQGGPYTKNTGKVTPAGGGMRAARIWSCNSKRTGFWLIIS